MRAVNDFKDVIRLISNVLRLQVQLLTKVSLINSLCQWDVNDNKFDSVASSDYCYVSHINNKVAMNAFAINVREVLHGETLKELSNNIVKLKKVTIGNSTLNNIDSTEQIMAYLLNSSMTNKELTNCINNAYLIPTIIKQLNELEVRIIEELNKRHIKKELLIEELV